MSVTQQAVSVRDERTLSLSRARTRSSPYMRRGWLVRRALFIADALGLAFAFLLAELMSGNPPAADRIDIQTEYVLFLLTLPGWVVAAKIYGLYERDEERADHSTVDEVVDVLHLVTVGAWLLFAGAWLTELADPNLRKLAIFWALSIVLITAGRGGARAYCRRHVAYLQNTIIVGAGVVGQQVAQKLLRHHEYGLNLVGFVDARPTERLPGLEHVALLGSASEVTTLVETFDIERVIVAFSQETHEETLTLIRSLEASGVQIAIVPRLFELVGPGVVVHTIEGIPMLGLPHPHLSRSSRLLKRGVDVVVSALALLAFAPLFVVVALLVRRSSPGPLFFHQHRVGAGGHHFSIYKFRTMRADADTRKEEVAHLNMHADNGGPRMFKIRDDPRITRVGRTLRRYSIDELPQFWNVLRGDMSLVGPRPLILDEDQHVGDWARRRLELRPGMTGLWQVLGRTDIGFEEMVKLDYLYVTTWSVANDLRLLWRTMPVVARGGGE